MKVIRRSGVADKCGNSGSTIDRWSNDPRFEHLDFPKPFKLGDNTTVWDEAEVDAWLEARAAERDTRLKFIADSYRNLPTPLKFTLVDIAAGKCIKVTAKGRDTPEAMQSYRNLMSECADWIRSDDALEHRDQVTTIKAILYAAKAEFLAIQAAIT